MKITNENYLIGYVGENLTRSIEYTFESELNNWSKHIEFQKSNGEKFTSKELSNNSSSFNIPYELLKEIGNLDVQLVAISNDGLIKKSPIKTFYISQSINATEELIESESDWKLIGDIYTQLHERATALEFEEGTNIVKLVGKDTNGNVVVLSQIQIPNSIVGDLTKYYTKEETIQYINENVLNRVNSLENSYQEFSNKLNELEKSNSELSDKVNDLDNLVDVIENNVNEIDNSLQENKNKVGILEKNILDLNDKTNSHETNIEFLNKKVDDFNNEIIAVKNKVESVDNKVESFEDDLSKLSGNINTIGANVTNLVNKVNELDDKVDEASKKVDEFEISYNRLSALVDTFDIRITNTENKVNTFETSLNDLESRFTNIENKSEYSYNKVIELEKEISSLEDNVRSLGTNVSNLGTSVSDLGANVSKLGTNVIKAQEDIEKLENENKSQEEKITNLENNSATKQFVYDNAIIKYNVSQTTSDIKKDVVYDVLQNREVGTYVYNNQYLVGMSHLYSNFYIIVIFDIRYNQFYKVEHIQKDSLSNASEISLTKVYSEIQDESITIEKLAEELANKINNSATQEELENQVLNLQGQIDDLQLQVDNLQAKVDDLPIFEKEVSTNAFEQVVPNNALDYALVEETGGMSYESENLLALEDVEETTLNGVTYSIKNGIITLNGTTTSTDTSFHIVTHTLQNLPSGDYSVGVYGMITDKWAITTLVQNKSYTLLLNINKNINTKGGTFNGSPKFVEVKIDTQAVFDNHKFCLKLVKGTTIPTIDLSTFENGYSGFYNAKVTSVDFEQKNLLQLQERTQSSPAYTAVIDKDGWITLNKPKGNGDIWFTLVNEGELNIPKGKSYSLRVRYYDENIPNLGSIVLLYEGVTDTPTARFMTVAYTAGSGYSSAPIYATKNVGKIYIYGNNNSIEIINAKFKVELVENSFMNDSIIIPSEVQALEGYGLGVDNNNYNYIRYNEETEQYEFIKNVASYTFTGNETFYLVASNYSDKYRIKYDDLSNAILKPLNPSTKAIIKTELLETISANGTYLCNNGISVDGLGDIFWYIDSIQTLEDFKAYITGKTLIYKLATPEVIDISSYMTDEYLQVQENGSVKFINEKAKAVPNKITYAIKVV